MSNDPSAIQHASRPGLLTYAVLVGIALAICVMMYGQSLKEFFGFN